MVSKDIVSRTMEDRHVFSSPSKHISSVRKWDYITREVCQFLDISRALPRVKLKLEVPYLLDDKFRSLLKPYHQELGFPTISKVRHSRIVDCMLFPNNVKTRIWRPGEHCDVEKGEQVFSHNQFSEALLWPIKMFFSSRGASCEV